MEIHGQIRSTLIWVPPVQRRTFEQDDVFDKKNYTVCNNSLFVIFFAEMTCPQTNVCVAHTGTWAHHLHMNNTFFVLRERKQINKIYPSSQFLLNNELTSQIHWCLSINKFMYQFQFANEFVDFTSITPRGSKKVLSLGVLWWFVKGMCSLSLLYVWGVNLSVLSDNECYLRSM